MTPTQHDQLLALSGKVAPGPAVVACYRAFAAMIGTDFHGEQVLEHLRTELETEQKRRQEQERAAEQQIQPPANA